MITIVAVIFGADDWNKIEEFGKETKVASKFSWIAKGDTLT